MKKIKQISKQKESTVSTLPLNACQEIINEIAESNIVMKTFTRHALAVCAVLYIR